MKRFLGIALPALLAFSLGCSDDETSGTGGGGTGASGNPGSGGSGAASNGGAGGTGAVGGSSSGGSSSGGAGPGGAGPGGGPSNCDALPAGPFDPVVVTEALNGSEDFAFDGQGHIVGKDGDNIVLVDAQGTVTELAEVPGTVYGLRYLVGQDTLLAALPNGGKLVAVAPDGQVTDYATGLGVPNGIYPDSFGNVWVTDFGGNKVIGVDQGMVKQTLVQGAEVTSPNGVVFDEAHSWVFYTEYNEGKVHRVDTAVADPQPALVAEIDGALDGMAMDACGNIYVMDQGGSDLYRVKLDAAGAATGEPEMLVHFPKNVANINFGSGAGFDPNKLYGAGSPGTVYSIDIGVAGQAQQAQ